jgi:DNA-directed RNA polymerase specialized sigma subunit
METREDRDQALEWVLEKLSAAKRQPSSPAASTAAQTKQEKQQELRSKQPKELELWQTWKKGGMKQKDLDPLLKSFAPLIFQRVKMFKGRVEVPTSYIEHVHKVEFVNALKTYDPKKAALNTHIMNRLQKAARPINTYKNFAYIPENVSKNIGAFNAFKAELSDRLGHEPDDHTIHDEALKANHPRLGALSLKDVKRLNQEQRAGLIQTSHDADVLVSGALSPRQVEVAHLISFQLTPEERLVHEHTLGLNGKAKLSSGDIAKKLKMDGPKVSKLRTSIWNKMKPYLGDE